MADISKITLPNGSSYNFKDEAARASLNGKITNNPCNATGTMGTSGMVAFARLVIKGAYANRPIEFELISRGRSTPCYVSVVFVNSSDNNPSLASLRYFGVDYGVFAHKTDTSTWLLYATKSESYDDITVAKIQKPNTQSIEITFPGTFITEKPTSNVVNATLGYNVGYADTVDGKHASDFAAASHTHIKSQISDFPTIPTKTSQLTNDSGFKTTDNNTTYSLSKSGSTITLTGSDGSTTSVTDSDTTYTLPAATSSVLGGVKIGSNITNSSGTISLTKANVTTALGYTPPTTNTTYDVATQSANGLMSATDKTKLDNMEIVTDESVGLRKLASGTAAATTTNCPVGCWYGKYS